MRAIDAQARVKDGDASKLKSLLKLRLSTPGAGRSRIGSLIEQGSFVTLVEIVLPQRH